MFITPFIMVIVLTVFTTINIKNKYASILTLYLATIAYMLFIAAVYVSKLTFYSFPFRIDYIIYLKFVRFRLSTLQISRLYNLAFALFMFSSLYGARQLLKTDTKRLIMLSLPIISFLILTDPMVRRNLYLHSYYIYSSNFSTLAGGALKIGFQLLLTFYLLFPYYYIAKFYRQTNYRIKRQNILILSLCITVINVFFCSVFMFGSFKNLLFYNVNPVGIPFEQTKISGYITIPVLTLIILTAIIAILMVCKPFNLFYLEYRKNRDIIKNTNIFNKNISMNLHAYKNMMWGAKQQFELIKVALDAKDYTGIKEYADNGIEMADRQLENLQNTLNSFNADTPFLENIDIVECLETAINKHKSHDVTIIRDFRQPEIITFGNKYIITEVFNNLIINALESFNNCSRSNPMLILRAELEDNICMIEITDNGCGIPRKEIKNIFNPFFSTKQRTKNSGIGLNFVKMIVKSYAGTIEVISKENKYTTFQITLPISQKKIEGSKKINEQNPSFNL